ncbi:MULTISPECIES: TetR/AcrR family transcriptional regulator [Streptosporangium]|uniref:AcrR family transcriptional regulator n=1 Tax=Streptosporangium brasiliense TaxID=47480 RepID=A0ABT9RA99_9ACTN|nr:TetR/AcrR family transcriptional regulator [Streptosporangium brasiliense]MDP9866143.1 AcrR family transcriptional regulator [Streptosporangium brasiliense]
MDKTPRRAPAERRRDPERTRERIIEAARAEFSAKGFAGARVSEIAARAGVNKQLISYYFGGKEGLLKALTSRWHSRESAFAGASFPLTELVRFHVRATVSDRDSARILIWEGLEESGGESAAVAEDMRRDVEDMRRRQRAGEFPDDLDPAHLLLMLFSASNAGAVFPQVARAICGEDPASEEFAERYGEQLARLLGHLRNVPTSDEGQG